MTVFFDHQAFCIQAYGGLSRYYTELIAGLSHTQTVTPLLPLYYSNNRHLQESNLHHRSFLAGTEFPKKEQIMMRMNRWQDIQAIRTRSFDLFHATYYNPYFLSYLNGKRRTPFVVTFLDMTHEKLGHQFPYLAQDKAILRNKRLLADQADRLIAVSESTKCDVVDLLGVDPAKIDVIYHGSSFAEDQMPSPEITSKIPNRPYLLYVGLRNGYKNFKAMVNALHSLLKREHLSILCAGGGSFTREERTLLFKLGLSNLVSQKPVTDSELKTLYQHAVAFVFPSLYEGFGIPVVEAFSCNCPCILSNRSSLPEIGGDGALYVSPVEPEAWPAAIIQLLTDNALRQTLIERGHNRLSQFSWQNAVRQTVQLYQSLVAA